MYQRYIPPARTCVIFFRRIVSFRFLPREYFGPLERRWTIPMVLKLAQIRGQKSEETSSTPSYKVSWNNVYIGLVASLIPIIAPHGKKCSFRCYQQSCHTTETIITDRPVESNLNVPKVKQTASRESIFRVRYRQTMSSREQENDRSTVVERNRNLPYHVTQRRLFLNFRNRRSLCVRNQQRTLPCSVQLQPRQPVTGTPFEGGFLISFTKSNCSLRILQDASRLSCVSRRVETCETYRWEAGKRPNAVILTLKFRIARVCFFDPL